MKFKLLCKTPFLDTEYNVWRTVREVFPCTSSARAKHIVDDLKWAKLVGIECQKRNKRGPKIIIYQELLYVIGGIETWDYNIARLFPDANITFIFTEANVEQAERLAKHHDVVIDDPNTNYTCDVFISANYSGVNIIIDRVRARRYYQMVHSDFSKLAKFEAWRGFKFPIDDKIDKVLSASETAQKGLKAACGIESEVLTNPLAPLDENDRPLVFMSMTRASIEKGLARMLKMAELFRAYHKNFVWIICATLENTDQPEIVDKLRSFPEVVIIPPSIRSQKLMWIADYGVQLSDTEAYCYTIREFLQRKVPCICTDFEEAKKIIKPGKNGYLLNMSLSNLDVEKIFEKVPVVEKQYEEKISPKWAKVMKGEL